MKKHFTILVIGGIFVSCEIHVRPHSWQSEHSGVSPHFTVLYVVIALYDVSFLFVAEEKFYEKELTEQREKDILY